MKKREIWRYIYIYFFDSYAKNIIVTRKKNANTYFKVCENHILTYNIGKIKIKNIYIIYNFLYMGFLYNYGSTYLEHLV